MPSMSLPPSCPDLIRASIILRKTFSNEMDCRVKPGNDERTLVSRTRCGILHAAPQSRDRTKHRRSLRPRLCSAPRREERRAALRPGHGASPEQRRPRHKRIERRPELAAKTVLLLQDFVLGAGDDEM